MGNHKRVSAHLSRHVPCCADPVQPPSTLVHARASACRRICTENTKNDEKPIRTHEKTIIAKAKATKNDPRRLGQTLAMFLTSNISSKPPKDDLRQMLPHLVSVAMVWKAMFLTKHNTVTGQKHARCWDGRSKACPVFFEALRRSTDAILVSYRRF